MPLDVMDLPFGRPGQMHLCGEDLVTDSLIYRCDRGHRRRLSYKEALIGGPPPCVECARESTQSFNDRCLPAHYRQP